MYYDSWGNEYSTKEEAKKGILEICRSRPDYYDIIADFIGIPRNVFKWILNTNYNSFSQVFLEDIDKAEQDWCSYYIDEIEYVSSE